MHTLNYPEIPDLTTHQQNPTLPLQYRLTGVVSHTGPRTDFGHYIASVRGRVPGVFPCISDEELEDFDLQEFLTNPQNPVTRGMQANGGFQVYMLCYERDDTIRNMPVATGSVGGGVKGRLARELRGLV